MALLDWDDPTATARSEATPRLTRGLGVPPTLIGFEGDEPTLYVRCSVQHPDPALAVGELVVLPRFLDLRRVLLVADGRATDPSIDDPVRRDAMAERGVLACRGWRDDAGRVASDGQLIGYERGDGTDLVWRDELPFDSGGPFGPALEQAVSGLPDDDGQADRLGPSGFAYALWRRGVAVAVNPDWRDRYGFDHPIEPRQVRVEDRARARRHQQRTARRARPMKAAS